MADFKGPGQGWRRATRREAIESGDYIHYNFTNEGASAVYWVPISTEIGHDYLTRKIVQSIIEDIKGSWGRDESLSRLLDRIALDYGVEN